MTIERRPHLRRRTHGGLLISAAVGLIAAWGPAPGAAPGDGSPICFVFFNRDRGRLLEPTFLETRAIAGALVKYTWRQLEPERDRYDLRAVLEDASFLATRGKKLFVQIQDVSFDERINVPDYLHTDPAFGGGSERKHEGARFDGWVARRWDPAVRARFAALLAALGRQIDGRVEGLVLAETAVSFGENGKEQPRGFTHEAYVEGIKSNMTAARRAFPASHVIQYANFMPGEWLPDDDRGYLRAVYRHADRIGVGVGGPDLLPHRRAQQQHSLPLIAARRAGVVAGLAVQDGNLEDVDPGTGRRVTPEALYRFARDRLRLDYIFWGTQEPYYSEQVLPWLRERRTSGADRAAVPDL